MSRDKSKQVTSLIEEFNYPKYGPGMMWERCTELVTERGTKVVMDSLVTKVEHADGRAIAVTAVSDGVTNRYECTDVISSMPISALLRAMDPPVPADVQQAADELRYRAHITVALVVPEEFSFPDNWIYINDANVKVGRVQNFGRWSPYLVKDGRTCLGLELFVDEGDEWWTKSDEDLVATGKRELEQIGLLDASKVEAGYVVRTPKAYPFYDARLQGERRHARGRGSTSTRPTCIRSAATACTGTTTRTTRCSRRCSPWRTSSAPTTTCGR